MDKYGHIFKKDGEKGFTWCTKCGAKPGSLEARTICEHAEYVHVSVMRSEIDSIMSRFGNVHSSKKLAKKMKQTYHRSIRALAQEKVDGLYKTFDEHLKPKPRWVPDILWRSIGRLFLKGVY